jgi:NarL family two-component system response regulator LiaR
MVRGASSAPVRSRSAKVYLSMTQDTVAATGRPTTRRLRVVLLNEFEIVRGGVAGMLADHDPQVDVVAGTTGSDAVPEADVILYDPFGRPPREKDEVRALTRGHSAKVVAYTWETPSDLDRIGASAWVPKAAGSDELFDAIVAVHEGRPWQCQTRHGGGRGGADRGQGRRLSERETQVLLLVTRGLTNAEIAEELYLSVNTVKTYLRTGYGKIGARSRAEAVGWAMRSGLRPPPQPPHPAGESPDRAVWQARWT